MPCDRLQHDILQYPRDPVPIRLHRPWNVHHRPFVRAVENGPEVGILVEAKFAMIRSKPTLAEPAKGTGMRRHVLDGRVDAHASGGTVLQDLFDVVVIR